MGADSGGSTPSGEGSIVGIDEDGSVIYDGPRTDNSGRYVTDGWFQFDLALFGRPRLVGTLRLGDNGTPEIDLYDPEAHELYVEYVRSIITESIQRGDLQLRSWAEARLAELSKEVVVWQRGRGWTEQWTKDQQWLPENSERQLHHPA